MELASFPANVPVTRFQLSCIDSFVSGSGGIAVTERAPPASKTEINACCLDSISIRKKISSCDLRGSLSQFGSKVSSPNCVNLLGQCLAIACFIERRGHVSSSINLG